MANYYVNNNAQANGDHEVHVTGCSYMPNSKIALGDHYSCLSAVAEAKKHYRQSNGCFFCSRLCHTS